jgi:ABC-2 type transport system ATP-binding protein
LTGSFLGHDKSCKALQEVGLLDARKKKVADLSKGMGRRLAWAMANISDPKFLVLDEPFSGLDPLGRIELHRWLGEKVKAGKGVLLCTHEIKLALSLCDRVQILRLGKECFGQDLRANPLKDAAELESYFVHDDQAV